MSLQQFLSKIVWGEDVRPSPYPRSTQPDSGTKLGTSPAATFMAVLLVLSVIATGLVGFLATPAGEKQWKVIQTVIATNNPLPGGGGTEIPGDFTCPEGIQRLEFDEKGVLKKPYPQLKPEPQRICFDLVKYQNFLALKGKTESGREIDGLTWLAETVSYPDWASMLDQVKAALKDIRLATNMLTVGWIELPGYRSSTPAPNPPPGESNPDDPTWATPTPFQPSDPTATLEPTDTAMPTLAVADIPTLVVVTPAGGRATQMAQPNFPTQAPVIATKKADALTQTCANVVEATRFWKLDELPIWSSISYLEFRWGEDGLFAMSDHVGGNGNDAFKRLYCIRQVLEAPGNSFDFGEGVTGSWDYSQVRVNPIYGQGDGLTNGRECFIKGLWLFNCSVKYPDKPTPTPVPPPTATPRANIGLDDLVSMFQQNGWSYQVIPAGNASDQNAVEFCVGPCSNWENPRYYVNFSVIWSLYQGGDITVGPCQQVGWDHADEMIDYKNSDICFAPFK